MVPRASMDAAHAAAVMVRAHGPDPKGRKMRRHAFFHTESGDTTLSASGFLSFKSGSFEPGKKAFPSHGNHLSSVTVPGSSVIVVTCASIVEPFLSQQPFGTSSVEARDFPKLIPGAEIDVLVEVPGKSTTVGDHTQCWIPAHLERVVEIPTAGAALQALLDVHGGSVDGAWEIGWALAPQDGNSQLQGLGAGAPPSRAIVEDEPSRRWAVGDREPIFGSSVNNGIRVGNLAMTATRVAILSLFWKDSSAAGSFQDNVVPRACEQPKPLKVSFDLGVSGCMKRGDFLLAVGSPFGALSPLHFHNSLSAGVVSNCWPPSSKPVALLMADLRCLPGMEGGPVLDEQGALAGMLIRPLRQRGGSAEVQLVMTSDVLAPALHQAGVTLGVPLTHQQISTDYHDTCQTLSAGGASSLEADSCRGTFSVPYSEAKSDMSPAISKALNSVVLVTIGDGAWASGVVLSESGLILTNAHLLEPWRFGKMRSSQHNNLLSTRQVLSAWGAEGDLECGQWTGSVDNLCAQNCAQIENSTAYRSEDDLGFSVSREPLDTTLSTSSCSAQSDTFVRPMQAKWKGYQRIRIRLDHQQVRSWHEAKAIYVSQGPLDIALLQLVSAPPGLCPIIPEKTCPPSGSSAVVIGHGLFGPRAELCPSVSSGVVARVVKAGTRSLSDSLVPENVEANSLGPAMLQTTAAVHPGGSGGAVVNSQGRMIGLVTSNARHSGGSVIPFLNFSVPYAALAPIFHFASKACADLSILSELDKPDKSLSAVWALVPSTPPRPPHSQALSPPVPRYSPQLPPTHRMSENVKGSRFAQFMAEKDADFPIQQQPTSDHGQVQSPKVAHTFVKPNSVYSQFLCSRL
ncbi:peroxisomal leader peptide-processing protease [Marchantia polymorpha subsp. ruderalis]|uniref:Glyoxysomal processing protease, glyoxysomal n=2 Tax=Marchantia polymorpha TaxID=3197 RepID=A0AAF6BTQ7_MARPO|nr:hypothetical protein MARPO_0045s0140 [Marchantia polymorpha]BBN15391.1 hypothetical protein Mp_6g19230 [Marchantia polymorpha subsp. ruderalis]|eukprot:PTQ39497.1 hypothetical protein MARPO_0045s0140 [Marchantia polymorpha]